MGNGLRRTSKFRECSGGTCSPPASQVEGESLVVSQYLGGPAWSGRLGQATQGAADPWSQGAGALC